MHTCGAHEQPHGTPQPQPDATVLSQSRNLATPPVQLVADKSAVDDVMGFLQCVLARSVHTAACRPQQDRGSLELLETEKQMCNLISKYSPEYVRSKALETPQDAMMVLVSTVKCGSGARKIGAGTLEGAAAIAALAVLQ